MCMFTIAEPIRSPDAPKILYRMICSPDGPKISRMYVGTSTACIVYVDKIVVRIRSN